MPRLRRTRSRAGDISLYSDLDQDRQIALKLDTGIKGFAISQRWLPTVAGTDAQIQVQEWSWQNGTGGAGTSIETTDSYAAGACEMGEFVWLRRIGVAQPSGLLTEMVLPTGTDAIVTGQFTKARTFGALNDLYLTTQQRYIVKVPEGSGDLDLTETDIGEGSVTTGIAVFGGKLYVSDTVLGIQEFDGSTWTEGAAATAGSWMETPYWTLGDSLATGGSDGNAGIGGDRLVVVSADGTGFRHVASDPKVDANYSAVTTVGIGGLTFPIVSAVASNRVVWFGTGLGVLGVDEVGHTPNLTKWAELIAAQNNAKAIAFWADHIWFATEQGLSVFKPTGERVDLGRFLQFGAKSGVTPVYGRPRVLAPSEDGLYVGYYNEQTGDSYVGILLMDDGGSLRWSMAEAVIRDEEVTFVQQASGNDGVPRLWIGTTDASHGLHLYRQDLPQSGDPEIEYVHGGDFRANPNWQVTLSRFNGGRAIPKTFRRFMLEADQLGTDFPGNTVEIQVAADGGAYAVAGTATDSPRWTSQPTAALVRATSAQIQLVVANASDIPVIIRSMSARYSPHPERTKVITAPIVIGEQTQQDPAEILARVELAQSAGPISINDHFGRDIQGSVESIDGVLTLDGTGESFEFHGTLTFSISDQGTTYDDGFTYDGTAIYS